MMMIIMLVKILKKRRFRFPPALFEVLRFFCNSTNPNVIFFQQWSRFHDFLMIFFSRFIFQFQARSVFLYIYLLEFVSVENFYKRKYDRNIRSINI